MSRYPVSKQAGVYVIKRRRVDVELSRGIIIKNHEMGELDEITMTEGFNYTRIISGATLAVMRRNGHYSTCCRVTPCQMIVARINPRLIWLVNDKKRMTNQRTTATGWI